MGRLESRWQDGLTRRQALVAFASALGGTALFRGVRDRRRELALDALLTTLDFEPVFRARVPPAVYRHTTDGTGSEFTLRRNRQAFEWVDVALRPDAAVGPVETQIDLFGHRLTSPILVAPTARQEPLHPSGEAGTYEAAAEMGTAMIVSNNSSLPFDRIARAATGTLWFQFYPRADLERSRQILGDVQAAGYQAVVVTIDQQVPLQLSSARRVVSPRSDAGDVNPYGVPESRFWYDWQYLRDIRPMVEVPLLAKGVLTGADARRCVDMGADGVVVSNHGGRSLDYCPSTLEVLGEVVGAIGGRVPVLVDSGFRTGSDVLKALALGAQAVCLGRAIRWGLGAYGAPGVVRILEIVQTELREAMASAGRSTVASIDPSAVRAEFP